MSKVQVVSELWQFMRDNKKFWLAPIIITLVLDKSEQPKFEDQTDWRKQFRLD
jgi:hypothetical protein